MVFGLFKKKKPSTERKTEEKEQTIKNEKSNTYQFVIRQIYNVNGSGCVVIGMLYGEEMSTYDQILIRNYKGQHLRSQVLGIELYQEGIVPRIIPGTKAGVLLKDIDCNQLRCGDVITNIENHPQE